VTGYFGLDGLLQLSLKPSVIQQKYFQVTDVEVGEVIKGTVKKLTDLALFVSLSGGIDGVVWPNHYADITLKHPSKRFQVGASIKCRVCSLLFVPMSHLNILDDRSLSLTQIASVFR
jgi:rRNA biogenesis protein RRP5